VVRIVAVGAPLDKGQTGGQVEPRRRTDCRPTVPLTSGLPPDANQGGEV